MLDGVEAGFDNLVRISDLSREPTDPGNLVFHFKVIGVMWKNFLND